MITVIVPHRSGRATDWTAERVENDSAVGVRVARDGQTTMVAFRKTDQGGGTVGGVTFETAVAVQAIIR
jgi:hypothetical protein